MYKIIFLVTAFKLHNVVTDFKLSHVSHLSPDLFVHFNMGYLIGFYSELDR
jgi:hypothetical protein